MGYYIGWSLHWQYTSSLTAVQLLQKTHYTLAAVQQICAPSYAQVFWDNGVCCLNKFAKSRLKTIELGTYYKFASDGILIGTIILYSFPLTPFILTLTKVTIPTLLRLINRGLQFITFFFVVYVFVFYSNKCEWMLRDILAWLKCV